MKPMDVKWSTYIDVDIENNERYPEFNLKKLGGPTDPSLVILKTSFLEKNLNLVFFLLILS